MATFFVTGATGTVGREVVQALLQQGQQVIAASRHPERSREQFGTSVKAVSFDFEDINTFSEVSSTDGVFLLGPPLYPDMFKLLAPFTDYLLQRGPKRIVYLSAYGMDDLTELPFHRQMEDKLKQAEVDWRIVRPGFFMQNFGNYERENIEQRKIIFFPAGEGTTGFVSARDIGEVVATLLVKDQHRHQTYMLTGEQAYTHFEVADLLSDIKGEKITYINPDSETYRSTLAQAGAPPFIADYMLPVYGLIKRGKVKETTQDIEKLTGRKPEPLRVVLERDFT
ncbi:MAG: SDR family oxidoreductase [Tunicatimonas sp.]|uniref:SDR family oxidoreductase n=1 Tax=Tunicatimonas sp. TaxID=1940096 RepID=UPI003C74BCD4